MLSWGILNFPGLCAAQEITDLTIVSDPDSLLKSLEITVDVPPLSSVRLQGNPRLTAAGWGDLAGDMSVFAGGETTFSTPLAGERGFFRFRTTPIPFSGSSDGVSFDFNVGAGISLPQFADLMRSQTGWPIFPQVMDTGLYRELDGYNIPPGSYSVANPADLGAALGLGLWVPGRPDDDGMFGQTYRPTALIPPRSAMGPAPAIPSRRCRPSARWSSSPFPQTIRHCISVRFQILSRSAPTIRPVAEFTGWRKAI